MEPGWAADVRASGSGSEKAAATMMWVHEGATVVVSLVPGGGLHALRDVVLEHGGSGCACGAFVLVLGARVRVSLEANLG